MSTLLSSFIIDPVVRQARRFSGAVPPPERGHGQAPPLSHANHHDEELEHSTPPPLIKDEDEDGHSATSTLDEEHAQPALIDTFRRYATTYIRGPQTGGEGEGSGEAASTDDNDGTTLLPSPLSFNLSSSTPIAIPLHQTMSQNPSHSLDDQLNLLTLSALPPTSSLAIPGHGPTRDTADQNVSKISDSLPADDGMRYLRARIQEIWSLKVSNEDKARLMHALMTERYNTIRPQSPNSFVSQERPFTPTSGQSVFSEVQISSPLSAASEVDPENPYNLRPGDTTPTQWIPPEKNDGDHGEGEDSDHEEESRSFGCEHYKRNVKVQCFECRRWYTCRHCHDAVEAHNLNRKKTENMMCMACGTPQPAGETCSNCGTEAAWYYCDICKLWDDDSSKKIYHCMDCGICRRGVGLGKDYVHCKRCNVCIAIAFYESHKCIERATECDCPICGEYLFNSQSAVMSIRCGHYLHKACHNLYMETAYKCPICKKSAVKMDLQWRKLTEAIECQPMPEQFANTRAVIHCNDCSAKSSVKYHWLGNKCDTCDSYNTNELRILDGPASEENANALLSAANSEPPVEQPPINVTAVSPSQRPLRSPRAYFQPDRPEETWLPDQLPSFPFQMPQLPQMPRMPQLPQMPQFRGMPNLPTLPQMPQFPGMPQVPDPYEMLERVRAFSPFRNYLNPGDAEGEMRFIDLSESLHEERDGDPGDKGGEEVRQPSLPQYVLERFSRSLSPLRGYLNPPTDHIPDLDLGEAREGEEGESGVGFWGTDGARFGLFGGEGAGGEDDGEEEESSSDESAEEGEDEEGEDDDDDDDDEADFQLPGHR